MKIKTNLIKLLLNKKLIFLLAFFIFGLGFGKDASAATYTVCSSGCDQVAIQGAFDNYDLAPGDIVEVRADSVGGTKTYNEMVTWGVNDGGDVNNQVILQGRVGDVIEINEDNIRTIGVLINSVNYVELRDVTITQPTVSGVSVEGTSTGVIVRNVISTNSGNQAFQNLGTASTTYYNITGANCIDDGFSMHDSTVAVIYGGNFDNNLQGINTINNSDLTTYNVTASVNSLAINGYAIWAAQNSGALIQRHTNLVVSGTAPNQLIINDGGVMAIDGLDLNGTAAASFYGQNGTTDIKNYRILGTYINAIKSGGSSNVITVSNGTIDASNITEHVVDIYVGTLNINYSIIKNIPSSKFALVARAGTTILGYNNAFYDYDKNGKGAYMISATLTLKNNIFQTLNTCITNGGSAISAIDYNLYYDYITKFSGTIISTNEILSDSKIVNAIENNFNLQSTSPAIDAGTSVGLTSDYAGNPIYGTPDIGAYEYQPPHLIGTDKIDIGAGARIYGDGKFRDLNITNAQLADLTITPQSESFEAYNADEVRPEWLNVTDITWNTTKEWTESINSALTNTFHTVGDLTPNNYYNISVDNILGSNIEGTNCTNGICKADSNGKIVFTYTGTYSTHTFKVEAGDNATPNLINTTSSKFSTNTTSVTLSLTTDENSTCHYSTNPTTPYDNAPAFTTTGETSHSVELINLTSGDYTYYAICRDSNNNESSYTLSFEIAPEELQEKLTSPIIKTTEGKEKMKNNSIIRSNKEEIKLQGEDLKLKNGTIKIYRNSKHLQTLSADQDGKWSKKIKLDKDFSGYLKIKLYNEFGTLIGDKKTKVKIDKEDPIFTTFVKPMTLVTPGKTKLSWEATDNHTISSYKIYLGGKIYKTKTNSFTVPTKTPQGIQYLRVKAYDKAGNDSFKETFVLVK